MADGGAVTYAEVRRWAVWLQVFTARELADALKSSLEVAERGVKALIYNRICEDSGDWIEGPNGPERLIAYIPLPPGPTHHPRETPPEISAPREMGGDPLKVPRGAPVARPAAQRTSRTGQWHPGRKGRKLARP